MKTHQKIQNIEKEYIYITAISEKSNQSNFKELSEYFKDEVYGFNAFFIHITKTKDNYKVQIGNYFDSAVELKLDYYLDEKEDRINNKHTKTFVIDSSARKINITYSIDNEKNNKLFELGDDSITYIDFMIQEENMLRKKIVI